VLVAILKAHGKLPGVLRGFGVLRRVLFRPRAFAESGAKGIMAKLGHFHTKTGSQMVATVAAPGGPRDRSGQALGEGEMSNAKTVQVSLNLPQSVFSALRQDLASFIGEMRLAAAIK
jgi:hypothetical protein